MNSNNVFESKLFRIIALSIAGFIILIFVFGLGVFVGTKKADFSFKWADEYHRNFGGPQGGFFGDFMGMDKEFTNANGVFGQIIKIDPSTSSGQVSSLTVKDKDNVEKIVLISNKTTIIYQKKNMKLSDLKIGDSVVVIGEPNSNGQIQGELIRLLPQQPKNMTPSIAPGDNQPQTSN